MLTRRCNLIMPAVVYDEVQAVADRHNTTVVDIMRRFVKLGLLAERIASDPNCALVIREGEREREIVVL